MAMPKYWIGHNNVVYGALSDLGTDSGHRIFSIIFRITPGFTEPGGQTSVPYHVFKKSTNVVYHSDPNLLLIEAYLEKHSLGDYSCWPTTDPETQPSTKQPTIILDDMTSSDFDLAIVGGGIGGLCLALCITSQTSIPVTIYENAPKFGEIGVGVAFGPNVVRALRQISKPLASAVEARANKNISKEKRNTWFDFRVGMDGPDAAAKARGVIAGTYLCSVEHPDPGSWMVNRSHLVEELEKLLPPGIAKFGKTVIDVEDNEKEGVILKFADGSTAHHSAAIGCDGIKSRVRSIIFDKDHTLAKPVYTGKYCYRGMVPMDKAVELLGEEKAKNCQAYLGYHGHMLTFPVAGGRMMNVVAFQSRKEWEHNTMVIPATKTQMLDSFDGWGEDVLNIVRLMGQSDIWALFDMPPTSAYHKGRLCFLGDAAHASTPFQGAGAGMAVEDAYVLGRIVRYIGKADDLPAAFEAFSAARVDRTQRVVSTSREAGHLWHFEAAGDDLEKIKENLQSRMNWIWNNDLDDDIAEVVSK